MSARRSRPALLAGLAIAVGGTVLLARTIGQGRSTVVAYPPLDVPKPVADDVWVVDSGPIHAAGLALPVRMTVVRLASGDLLLHSPTRFGPGLADALRSLGRVRHLVAPTLGHWTFVRDWQRAFPEVRTWATPSLRERAPVRRSNLRIDADLGDAAPSDWSGEIAQGVVRGGGGFPETWFIHRPRGTLILTDLIENLDPAKLPPATGLLMRATLATRATAPLHVRAILAMRKRQARDAVAAMVDLAPERVIFAHGRWFERDGAARLREAFSWLID